MEALSIIMFACQDLMYSWCLAISWGFCEEQHVPGIASGIYGGYTGMPISFSLVSWKAPTESPFGVPRVNPLIMW